MRFPGRGACRHAINPRLFTPTPAGTARVVPARRPNDAPRCSLRAAGIRRPRAIFLTCTSKLYWNPVLILNPTDCFPIRHHPTCIRGTCDHLCTPTRESHCGRPSTNTHARHARALHAARCGQVLEPKYTCCAFRRLNNRCTDELGRIVEWIVGG